MIVSIEALGQFTSGHQTLQTRDHLKFIADLLSDHWDIGTVRFDFFAIYYTTLKKTLHDASSKRITILFLFEPQEFYLIF